jgi:alpha-tubulin suppressor-like RCC1 family protein
MRACGAASGNVRDRGVGRLLVVGATLVGMLGVLAPSPGRAAIVQVPATSDRPVAADHRLVAGAGAPTPQVAAGEFHTCALLEDGTVRCWGNNLRGQLGDGTTDRRSNPVQVLASGTAVASPVPLDRVTRIAAGRSHTCALLEDRTVRCWGSNASGRLGDGTTDSRLNPVQVLASGTAAASPVALGGVTQIAAGNSHTCALLEDRTVRCWGSNVSGRLGDGTTGDRLNPVQVLASGTAAASPVVLGEVTQIATGITHTCALLEDRTARCWGANGGEVGDGTTVNRLNPVQVLASGTAAASPVALGGVTQILTGETFTCALLEDGTVRCWGWNGSGRLGDGTTDLRLNPVQVLASGTAAASPVVLGGVTQVALGKAQACALLEDRSVRCWGNNEHGQLGDGTTTDRRLNPVQVLASGTAAASPVVLGGVTQVAVGEFHTCALLVDGTVRCWGRNFNGELGDGTTDDRLNPAQVLASGTAAADAVVFLVAVISPGSGPENPSLLAVGCDGAMQVGSLVTCTVSGGEPGIEILWRASYNPLIAEAGVTLDDAGAGGFSFLVPAEALGQVITVELVEWTAPMPLGVVGGPVPATVPAGEGPVTVWSLVLVLLAGGLAVVRRSRGGSDALRRGW